MNWSRATMSSAFVSIAVRNAASPDGVFVFCGGLLFSQPRGLSVVAWEPLERKTVPMARRSGQLRTNGVCARSAVCRSPSSDSGSVPAGAKRSEKLYCAALCAAIRGSSGHEVTSVVIRTIR